MAAAASQGGRSGGGGGGSGAGGGPGSGTGSSRSGLLDKKQLVHLGIDWILPGLYFSSILRGLLCTDLTEPVLTALNLAKKNATTVIEM